MTVPFSACGPVCVCGHQNHRQHRPGHHAVELPVRLHWCPALQGRIHPQTRLKYYNVSRFSNRIIHKVATVAFFATIIVIIISEWMLDSLSLLSVSFGVHV